MKSNPKITIYLICTFRFASGWWGAVRLVRRFSARFQDSFRFLIRFFAVLFRSTFLVIAIDFFFVLVLFFRVGSWSFTRFGPRSLTIGSFERSLISARIAFIFWIAVLVIWRNSLIRCSDWYPFVRIGLVFFIRFIVNCIFRNSYSEKYKF